MKLEENNI